MSNEKKELSKEEMKKVKGGKGLVKPEESAFSDKDAVAPKGGSIVDDGSIADGSDEDALSKK